MASRSEARERNGCRMQPPAGRPVLVRVVLMGELKRWAGRQEVTIELPAGSTVRELAGRLRELCGESFSQKALTPEGWLQPHVAVFINGVQMGKLEGSRTELTGGQVELMLLPVYEGG